jgi:hypothetical protein
MAFGFGFGMPRSFAVPPFSPASLFTGGIPGVWYDPSDYGASGTLFQDSAGTTPVTAVEQPVGLMLDKSQGLVLGPEKVVNGGFDSSVDWILGANVSITGSALVFSSVGSTIGAQQTVSTYSSNSYYKITVVITSLSAGQFRVKINSGTFVLIPASVGTHTLYVYSGTATASGLEFLAAGTTTGSVSEISVKELPGNHAFQSTSASRPVLSARYNLLTKTEQFDDAAWLKTNVTVTANATTAPDGTTTAEKLSSSTGTWPSYIVQAVLPSTQAFSVYAKQGACRYLLMVGVQFGEFSAYFDLQNGTSNGTAGFNRTITPVGNGWYRCTVSGAFISTLIGFQPNLAGSGLTPAAAGDGIYIWGASLVPANQSTLPYQRVNTSTDYATTGFLPYLKFDGVDDSLSTNSINFTSTDKMSVFAGVRKLSDAAVGQLVELGANVSVNSGTFSMPNSDGGLTWVAAVKGLGTVTSATATGITAPITTVNTSLMDLSLATGDVRLRINGTQAAASTTDTGGGNFSNYPLYIGRRNNASFPFNGQMYSMIIVGKAVTAGELTSTETYVNTKTGAY